MKKAIKILSLIMVTTLILSSVAVSASAAEFWDYYPEYEEPYYSFGDVDLNESITVKDATALQKYLAKIITLSEDALYYADVDGNEKVTISDVTCIQKYVAKIIDIFPVEDYAPDYSFVLNFDNYPCFDVELTADSAVEIMFTVEVGGYYNIFARADEDTPVYLDLTSEDMEEHWIARYSGGSYLIYAKLEPGVYYAYMYLEYGEDTTVEFNAGMTDYVPFAQGDAVELNIGDRIDHKAGKDIPLYKVNVEKLESYGDQLCVYADGENPLVNMLCYDKDYRIVSEGYDDGTGKIMLDIYDDGENTEYYILITQEEGGSDFTLCCDTYYGMLRGEAVNAELGTIDEIALEEYVEEYEGETLTFYITQAVHKFAPEKSGYYSFNYYCDNATGVMAVVADLNDVDNAYILIDMCEEAARLYDVLYLDAGVEYYIISIIEADEAGTVDFTVLESDEEEYNEAQNKNNFFESSDDEAQYKEISIGDTVEVNFSADREEFVTEDFVFTAEEDSTIVLYSEGSQDACVYVLDDEMLLHLGDDIRTLISADGQDVLYESFDFAVIGTVEKGETVYFGVGSNEFSGDSFTFTVLNEADYIPVA